MRFLPGWFRDTLPTAPVDSLAVMRLDGDMYESTMVALESLYPKLSPGGFAIIDDYGAVAECKLAVEDYRCATASTSRSCPSTGPASAGRSGWVAFRPEPVRAGRQTSSATSARAMGADVAVQASSGRTAPGQLPLKGPLTPSPSLRSTTTNETASRSRA